jgi:hypothetical protein
VLRDLTEIIDMAKVPRSAALGANAGTEMRCTAFLPAREHRASVTWVLDDIFGVREHGESNQRDWRSSGAARNCRWPGSGEKSHGRAMDICSGTVMKKICT